MRRISYGINSYHRTASFYVEFASPFVFALYNISDFVCGIVPRIPLPNFKIVRDSEETTIKEYYGDLNDVFHLAIHCPILDYCSKRTDEHMISADYDKMRKVFYNRDKEVWDENEEGAREILEEDKNDK